MNNNKKRLSTVKMDKVINKEIKIVKVTDNEKGTTHFALREYWNQHLYDTVLVADTLADIYKAIMNGEYDEC